jgi:hypothetical protein
MLAEDRQHLLVERRDGFSGADPPRRRYRDEQQARVNSEGRGDPHGRFHQ